MKSLKAPLSCLAIFLLLALVVDARACENRACLTSGPRLANLDSGRAALYSDVLGQFTGSRIALGVGDWNSLAGGGGNEDFLQAYPFGTTYISEGPQSYSGEALGLASPVQAVDVSALLTEPPIQLCGPAGTTFRSAAMRVKMDFTLDGVTPDTSALAALPGISAAEASLTRLALYAETGRGSGSLVAVGGAAGAATVQATPGVAALYLGSLADGVFSDRSRPLDAATDLDFAPIGRLRLRDAVTGSETETLIEARSHASGQGAAPQTLNYAAPWPQTRTATSGTSVVAGLAADLANNLELRTSPSLGALDSQVRELLLPALRDTLAPLLQTLAAQALDPAFHLLGLGLGEMDVTIEGIEARCTVAGSVFADADHDGSKGAGEAGTGEFCYVKLLPADGAGPALQVVAPDPASGRYQFDGVLPGSYLLVVNRDSDAAAVTPLPPAGWVATAPHPPRRALSLAAADASGQDFGLYHGSRVAGTVFKDNGANANNGLQEVDETGIAGIAVEASDGTGTLHGSTVTGGNGAYTLWLPAGAAGSLRVTERNAPAMISVAGSPGDTGGSYDRNLDTVSFTPVAGSAYSGVDFADVPANTFSGEHRQSARAGAVVFFPHVFVAGSAGRLALTVSGSPDPAGDWNSLTYVDADCNGSVDAGEAPLAAPVDMTAGERLCLVVKTFVPANAPADVRYAQTLAASFRYANAGFDAVLSRGDLTLVGAASLRLTKNVDKAAAGPGETLTYTLRYENLGAAPLHDLKIHDATPAYTVFAAARCESTPSGLACQLARAPTVADAGALEWRFSGALPAAAAGSVSFSVTVQAP